MAAFPRLASCAPKSAAPFKGPAALQSWSHSGKGQTRATMSAGRSWGETYIPFLAESIEGRAFLAFLARMLRTGEVFTIQHPGYLTNLGGGTGSVTVNGAGQTGITLSTTGWGGSNPVLRAGEIVKVAGVPYSQTLAADAGNLSGSVAILTLDPPIWVAPSNGAAVLYASNVVLNAILLDYDAPEEDAKGYISGMRASFREQLV